MSAGPVQGPSRDRLGASEASRVERRVYIHASPSRVWATLHDPDELPALFPELATGPEVTVAVPYIDADIHDLAGLTALGERLWR